MMLHKEFETANTALISQVLKANNVINTTDLDNLDPVTAREVITEMMKALSGVTEHISTVTEGINDILKEIDYKLLDDKGKFKKVGVFKWANVASYIQFAEFVKNRIITMKDIIIKK